MRLAEKTIELTYCSQLSAVYPGRLVWFGLTQRQEARAGFDVCAALGGRLILLQFKASCEDVGGARRFHLAHPQLSNLRARCTVARSVYYALPMVGTTSELSRNSDVLSQTWLLDVATLPVIPPPTTKHGWPRKSGRHYLDVKPPAAILHSEPIDLTLIPSTELIGPQPAADQPSTASSASSQALDVLFAIAGQMHRAAVGIVLLP